MVDYGDDAGSQEPMATAGVRYEDGDRPGVVVQIEEKRSQLIIEGSKNSLRSQIERVDAQIAAIENKEDAEYQAIADEAKAQDDATLESAEEERSRLTTLWKAATRGKAYPER